jgi:hypothetical protein
MVPEALCDSIGADNLLKIQRDLHRLAAPCRHAASSTWNGAVIACVQAPRKSCRWPGRFQPSGGPQVVGGGVLREMGRAHAAALANLLGYYALALPLGYLLAFRMDLGPARHLAGLTIGLLAV